MSSRKYSNAEELNERWLRLGDELKLETSYKQPPIHKARVIPMKEEQENKERWLREHFGTFRAANTRDSMKHAEILRSQQEMQNKIDEKETEKASEKVKKILQKYKLFIPKILTHVANKVKNNAEELLYPQPKLELKGQSPPRPHSKGGYNSQKYKCTNIAKKPTKHKILTKKPAKQKTMAKKPAKQKTMAKKPAKPKIMAKKPAKPKI